MPTHLTVVRPTKTVTADYTVLAGDAGYVIEVDSPSLVTITLPQDSVQAFPVGASVHIVRAGAGAVAIATGTGATVVDADGFVSPREIFSQWGHADARKRAANTWHLIGYISNP
jgi:hypothetical protein